MNLRPLLFFVPVAAAVAGFVWMSEKEAAPPQAPQETAIPVRVQTLQPIAAKPLAIGYGRVEAVDSWSAISQVQGRATMVVEDLAVGTIIDAGREIIRIDPRDYEIALARAVANKNNALASLDELIANQANTQASIALEQRIEDVRRAELERQQTLLARGSVAQSVVDTAERNLLAQEKVVLSLENSLRLIPAQRAALDASIETRTVEIEEAERALQNTSIAVPIRGRVVEKSVAVGQFTRVGDKLATIESIAASEITAAFQTRVLGNLFSTILEQIGEENAARLADADPAKVLPWLQLDARVRLKSGEEFFDWPAQLVRFDGSTDQTTGTVGLVVRVEEPTRRAPDKPGPPLSNGSFVEVRLTTHGAVSALRVPRSAIHHDGEAQFVYVLDGASRLARRAITTGTIIDDTLVVTSGLNADDVVVLSDPQPAVIGMLLDPIEDGGA